MNYLISEASAPKLRALLAETDDPLESRAVRGGIGKRRPLIVRCTSATAIGGDDVGDQSYPAVVIGSDATVDTQPELGDVWLTLLGDGGAAEVPTADALYHGLVSGLYDPDPGGAGTDERSRVFAVAPAAGGGGGSLTSGTYAPASPITITADSTWTTESSGGVSLVAGTYFITAHCTSEGDLTAAAGTGISNRTGLSFRLYNNTDSVAISEGVVCCAATKPAQSMRGTGSLSVIVTLSGTKVIRFQGLRGIPYDTFTGQTWNASPQVALQESGTHTYSTALNYLKIG